MDATFNEPALNEASYDACVSAIYRAASGGSEWAPACELVSRSLDLFGVHIIGIEKQSGRLLFSWEGGEISKTCFFDYVTQYHSENPRLRYAISLSDDEWVHDQRCFDRAFIDANPFFQDFAIPYGVRHLSGTKIAENDEFVVMFGAIRSPAQTPLNKAEMVTLVRLRGHLVNAMAIYFRLRKTIDEMSAGYEILRSLPYPTLLIETDRKIVHSNPAAKNLQFDSEFLSIEHSKVRILDKEADDAMAIELKRIEQSLSDGQASVSRKFVIAMGNPKPLAAVTGVVVDPNQSMRIFGVSVRVLLLLHVFSRDTNVDPFVVAQIFGLTPAESMVATDFVNGGTTKSIAAQRGVSAHTIRSQVRSVYQKLDIGSQAELTKLLVDVSRCL